MKLKLNYFLPLILMLTGCSKFTEPSITLLQKDFEARRHLKDEKYEDALQSYYNLVEINPNFAGTHSNIGILLNMVQKPEEALKSLEHGLQVAKETKDFAAEFAIQYNLGTYFGQLKKIDEAIGHYQAALDIVPSSIEAKTNIELLIQQKKQSGQNGDQSQDQKDQQNQQGQSDQNKNQNDKSNQEKKDDKKDGQDKDKENKDNKDEKDKDKDKDDGKKRESSPKYKPRPFKGEQLSEGDVKKILGELRNQEQKIRANFEKKEKGKTRKNEKDW